MSVVVTLGDVIEDVIHRKRQEWWQSVLLCLSVVYIFKDVGPPLVGYVFQIKLQLIEVSLPLLQQYLYLLQICTYLIILFQLLVDVLLLIPRRHLFQLKQRHCIALLNPGTEVFVHLGVDFASQ